MLIRNCLLQFMTFGCPGIDFGNVGNYVLYCTIQYNLVQHSTVQYYILYCTIQYNLVEYSTVQ